MTTHRPVASSPAPLDFRYRPLPAHVARQVHLVPPGGRLHCSESPWSDALAVLEAGCVELRVASGARLHLCAGAIFSLRGLTPAVVAPVGPAPAVLSTLLRRTPGGTP